MLELQILAANVLLPTLLLTLTLGGVLWASRRSATRNTAAAASSSNSGRSTFQPSRLGASVLVLAGVFAVWLALVLRVEEALAWWPEDAWTRLPIAIGMVGLGAIIAQWLPSRLKLVAWLLRATALWLATRSILPAGEAWEFLQPSVPIWTLVLVLGPLLAWWLIERLPSRAAGVLGLSWILCVAAAAFLSKDFLRVTEPMLAIASVLGCVSLGTLFSGRSAWVATVAGPCLFGSGAAVASFQFNSFLGLPDSLSWLAILAPAAAALVTLSLPSQAQLMQGMESKSATEANQLLRISRRHLLLILSACLSLSLVVIVWTLVASAGGAGGEEAW